MLEFIVLGTLCYASLSGYEIRKRIENGIGMFYKASCGSIYPILAKLDKKELVTCEEEGTGSRNKKTYCITEDGRKAFDEWLLLDDSKDTIETFMARVFFFDRLPDEEASRKIQKYERNLKDYEESLLLKRNNYTDLPNYDEHYYKISTLYFGICKLQSILKWCRVVKDKEKLEELIK